MTLRRAWVRREWIPSVGVAAVMVTMFCHCHHPRRIETVTVANRWLGPATIAVAPAINLSGSTDFDPNRFADLMASELSYAHGVSVVPVSRVLTALAAQGAERVESPTHALELIKLLGADAILVFAVTEYDPYDPPSIGITAQLYGRAPIERRGMLDPVALSRRPRADGSETQRNRDRLLAQTQRVYDASHGSVVDEIKRFAALRDGDGSPYGWRRFVVTQEGFIRYCCHATVRALLAAPPGAERAEDAEGGKRR